ncbi:MAG: hypothetical protein CMG64_06900 [Candidatus Marinimicrobia bacterium]|nr:hypothetical protein [Candidatus Neomarinimicrobiota bacterium]
MNSILFKLYILLIVHNVMFGMKSSLIDTSSFIGVCSQITRQSKAYNPYSIHKDLLNACSDANINFTRTGFKWKFIHPSKDEWNWAITDTIVNSAKIRNVKILALIGSMPVPFMESPLNYIDLWLEFVDSLTIRYKSDIFHWEIWNEPNIRSGKYWPQNQLPEPFAEYVIRAAEIIKKNQPESIILLSGLASSKKSNPFGLWESLFKLNVLEKIDGVAYHPYKYPGLKLIEFNKKLKKLISKYSKNEKQLWVTEFGIPAVSSVNSGKFSFNYQKDQILQSILVHWATGGSKFFIYSLIDKSEMDPRATRKQNRQKIKGFFGLLEKNMLQKPSYKGVKWLSSIINDYNPLEIEVISDGIIITALNKKNGEKAFFSWGSKANNRLYDNKSINSVSFAKSTKKEIQLDTEVSIKNTFGNSEVVYWY